MKLTFSVEKQTLKRTDSNHVVDKSNNYLEIDFSFSNEWEDTVKYCLFGIDSGTYVQRLINDNCVVPTKILEENQCVIGVYGIYRNTRITTNTVRVLFDESNYTDDLSSADVEIVGDVFTEIFEIINAKADDADISVVGKTGEYTDLLHLPNLSNVAVSGSYDDLTNKPTLESLGGVINITRQSEPDEDYFATYIVTQNGSQVGVKINIPKDKLLKSCELKTCTVEDVPPGFHVGEKYLDMVFNTADGGSIDRHQYVNLSGLIDVYTADGTTLELVNGQFKVKNGGIGSTQLASDVNTKLGYADTFNSSPCKNITNNDISAWNSKQTTNNLVTSWSSTLSDTKYPSEKLVKEYVDGIIGDIDDWLTR